MTESDILVIHYGHENRDSSKVRTAYAHVRSTDLRYLMVSHTLHHEKL